MIQIQKKPGKHLITAYNRMMAVMRDAFENADASDMSLQKALDMAQYKVVHLGAVGTEEAHEISEYIKRDINDAAEYMMETSAEFYDWLLLDIDLVERKVVDLFLSVADNTRIELERFKQTDAIPVQTASAEVTPAQLRLQQISTEDTISQHIFTNQVPVYKSGEIAEPGSLICENCGKTKPFLTSNKITNCKECGHDRYIRRRYPD